MRTKIDKISTSWFFFLRPLSQNKELGTVCFAVSVKGKLRKAQSTGITVAVCNWCKTTKRVKWGGELVNAELQKIAVEVEAKIREQVVRFGVLASPAMILAAYNNSGDKVTLMSFLDIFLKQKSKELPASSLRAYKYRINRLKAYLSESGLTDISLFGFQSPDLHRFGCWLKENGIDRTAFRIISLVKTVFNSAVLNGYLPNNHLAAYSMKRAKPLPPKYLTKAEIDRLACFPFTGYLQKAADMFLFQCHTGLAYVDMAGFIAAENLKNDGEGFYFIEICREKTGERSIIPLLPEARDILEKYAYALPVISNQKYNQYIKEAGKTAGLPNPNEITTHIGRKTFAMRMIDLGYSLESVSRMLGHADTRMVLSTYAKVSHNRVKKEFNDIHNGGNPPTPTTQWTITKNAS